MQTKHITWAELRNIVENVINEVDYDHAKQYDPELAEDPEHPTFDDITDQIWEQL